MDIIFIDDGVFEMLVSDVQLIDLEVNDVFHETYSVNVYIERGVEYPNHHENYDVFCVWVQNQARSTINTKDDRIAARPNIWPDGTQHSDVYRAWHRGDVDISIRTSEAPPVY
ncbi:hypothetical protein [Poriferisphaera sp. WC338]|uniref:hypothetical protein n=1 Tax=Poriferisphaera sp. WC338 TaxID=3425129 RepID=UPI003D816FDE